MPIRYIDSDEWYPVYFFTKMKSFTAKVKLTQDKIDWINQTSEEFNKVQTFLGKRFNKSKQRREA